MNRKKELETKCIAMKAMQNLQRVAPDIVMSDMLHDMILISLVCTF